MDNYLTRIQRFEILEEMLYEIGLCGNTKATCLECISNGLNPIYADILALAAKNIWDKYGHDILVILDAMPYLD